MIQVSERPVRDRTDDESREAVTPLHPYGVGIDTHKKFIQVCVLTQEGTQIVRVEREFTTEWPDLKRAKAWACNQAKNAGIEETDDDLRYVIESTGTYHMPVVQAFGGKPCIINPMLAGPTKRKTDVLDARMLAHHSICGLWRDSFVPPRAVETLRVLLSQRFDQQRLSTRVSNRINNTMLRYGHTFGRESSMRDATGRAICEDLARGIVPNHPAVCPDGLPTPIQHWVADQFLLLDQSTGLKDDYERRALDFAKQMDWPTAHSSLSGREMLRNLCSVPGVGIVTALVWLAIIVDPNRFEHHKQLAAYVGSDPSLKVSAGKVTAHVKRKGNARLHHVLKMVAARQIRVKDSKIGAWGRLIQRRQKHAGFGRAVNAVARRMAIMLWNVQRVGERFDISKYDFYKAPKVLDVPLDQMGLSTRVVNILTDANLNTAQDVANALMTNLPQQKGFGPKCLEEVKAWIEQNPAPKEPPTQVPARNARRSA